MNDHSDPGAYQESFDNSHSGLTLGLANIDETRGTASDMLKER